MTFQGAFRTEEFAARNRGEDFDRLKYAEEEELFLSPLPCWAHLTPDQYPDQYRERIAELVEEIEAEARADREARGVEPWGVEAILRQDPHTRPNQTKKSPAPACHAASKAFRKNSGRSTPPSWPISRRPRRSSRRESGRSGSLWVRSRRVCPS